MRRIGIDSPFAIERIPAVYPYGVKWVTNNSSPVLTKGYLQNGNWVPGNYPFLDIQSRMRRCVLSAAGAHQYYLDPVNSIYKDGQTTPTAIGSATSTSTGHLVNSAAGFIASGVVAGMWVHNTTTNSTSLITAVAATDLTLEDDIFVSGNSYNIGTANPMADGAVYVEVPQFSYVWTEDGVNTYFIISLYPFQFNKADGTVVKSAVHPWFYEGDIPIPASKKYFSAFESVWYKSAISAYSDHDGATVGVNGDKAVSLPGYTPLTYQYRRTATAYQNFAGLHAAFGSNHHSQGFYAYEAIWLLMTIEYASLNGQSYLPGYTDASAFLYAYTRKTGRTMKLGNTSGSIAVDLTGKDEGLSGILDAGKYVANCYRGIENIYGHIWKWVDGINIDFGLSEGKVYLSNNPAQWAENTAINYTDTSFGLPLSSGYTSALHLGRLLPKLVAGGSTTYLCDNLHQPGASAGWRGLIAGGYLYNGANGGPAGLNAYYSGSDRRIAPIGGRAAA